MAELPIDYNTAEYKLNISSVKENHDRPYFGMSYLGSNCTRSIQYAMRLAYPRVLDANQHRTFNIGIYLENLFYDELRRIGIFVTDKQSEVIGFAGHWLGHIDGIASNIPESPATHHLLELKTHNDAMFKKLVKDGVHDGFLSHYKQMQRYMAGLKLKRGLYVALNKNTSQIYVERIYHNKEIQNDLISLEKDLIWQEDLFPRIGNDSPAWFECKMCLAKRVCFNHGSISKNCRTCAYSNMEMGGKWSCGFREKALTFAEQKDGCEEYTRRDMFNTGD